MESTGWERMAEWWDENIGDDGDLWHRTLIDPPVYRLVGDVAGQRVLDLACGNGYMGRRFARQGAAVVGVDANGAIIARARAREAREPLGIVYHVADAAALAMVADGQFDLVVCNMGLMDIENAAGAIAEASRVLVPQGRFIFSICHPCFDKSGLSGWQIEEMYPTTTVWRKITRYREITVGRIPWLDVGNEPVYTSAYDRPLSWYTGALRVAGFVIAGLEEPEPTAEFLAASRQGAWIAEIPMHCVIEAWKRIGRVGERG